MGIFGGNEPVIKKIRSVGKMGCVDSGVIFSLKNGRGRLKLKRTGTIETEDYDQYMVSQLMLGDKPLTEIERPYCPTCESLLGAGYGIEQAECGELRRIADGVNAEFISVENSLEVLAPVLGLLEDGVYMLADAECYPTDGQGGFFWDIEPKKKLYEAAVSWMYIGSEDGVYLFSGDVVPPLFLYPTQSAAMMNRERVEHYRGIIGGENAPRAVALNYADGLSFLIDGHHKAAAAALEGRPVRCLLIIPEVLDFVMKSPTSAREFKRQMFGGAAEFTREQISTLEFAGIVKRWELRQMKSRKEKALGGERALCRFERRAWEEEFSESAKRYPTARQLVLERIWGIDKRYGEIAAYLEKFVTDRGKLARFAENDPFELSMKEGTNAVYTGLKLIFRRGLFMGDRRLKYAAMACMDHEAYYLAVAAMRYLMMFRGDEEVEDRFIGIISDADKYERLGDTAVDFWEDEE
ncbi:hypothetical protein [Ruminococcus sp.]|uniref:hypothetical protein n=1 Tax=Ruminococcus sp. TaxID=41978 RepID=UPI0025DF9BBD|nr:hypothetical protein [Ruminococcus sp.]MBQ8967305.1 hypothetical protein [Ruminococcus sp.]